MRRERFDELLEKATPVVLGVVSAAIVTLIAVSPWL